MLDCLADIEPKLKPIRTRYPLSIFSSLEKNCGYQLKKGPKPLKSQLFKHQLNFLNHLGSGFDNFIIGLISKALKVFTECTS